MNYYNDTDPHACHRLRSLISAGLIPPGHVDQRSIADVRPADLAGFVQCHFFAGIGGWAEALRLAGVQLDVPLWTGSCPCQPFSSAGQRRGTADERHLWPVFRDLIAECRPPAVFGEQVASADGRAWLDVVRSDLEALGYAVGAADLCAAGIGAPHIRQRFYFVGMADADGDGCEPRAGNDPAARHRNPSPSTSIDGNAHQANSFWSAADWLCCRDGKWRPVEPGTFPLVNGLPGRVAHLRGYGNAIAPQVAATFIRAALSAE